MSDGSFTVATIAREPLSILRRFVDWHLGQGADRIILFLDDPDDPAARALKGEPRLDMRLCTPALWQSVGTRADARFTRRQRAAMTAAYREAATDWVLIADADELLWVREGTIPALLSAQPRDVRSLRVRSAETVALPGGQMALRLPIARAAVNRVYGADADLFRKREGLVGHAEGKALHRAGMTDVRIKLHWAETHEGTPLPGPVLGPRDRVHLVHDVAPGYARWRAKLDWRAGAHGFAGPLKTRIRALAESGDPEPGYRALYDRLHHLSESEAAALAAEGGLLRELPPDRMNGHHG